MTEATALAQQAVDELAIRNLYARLAQLADTDSADLTAYMALYTEDASWEMPGASPRTGHAAILAGARERRAAGTQGPGTHTRHVITTIAVTVNGDRATGQAYYLFFVETDKTPRLSGIGHYHDTFARTSDGWKLARRQITVG